MHIRVTYMHLGLYYIFLLQCYRWFQFYWQEKCHELHCGDFRVKLGNGNDNDCLQFSSLSTGMATKVENFLVVKMKTWK